MCLSETGTWTCGTLVLDNIERSRKDVLENLDGSLSVCR